MALHSREMPGGRRRRGKKSTEVEGRKVIILNPGASTYMMLVNHMLWPDILCHVEADQRDGLPLWGSQQRGTWMNLADV